MHYEEYKIETTTNGVIGWFCEESEIHKIIPHLWI